MGPVDRRGAGPRWHRPSATGPRDRCPGCRTARGPRRTLRFGGVIALDGLSFSIAPGQVCALIGPNGAGKTTLFNVVSRLYEPDGGSVSFDGDDLLSLAPHGIAAVGIARTFQNLALVPGLSVLDNVMVGAHARTTGGFWAGSLGFPARQRERALRTEALAILERLGPGAGRQRARRRTALRHAQADRAGPGARRAPQAADARRAGQRPDPRRGRRARRARSGRSATSST